MKHKSLIPFDERTKNIFKTICTIMYFITSLGIIISIYYRTFILEQNSEAFEDLNILITFNVIFLITSLLYFVGIPFSKLKPYQYLLLYVVFVFFGFTFAYFKYSLFAEYPMTFGQVFEEKFLVVAIIFGILFGFFSLFGYLGQKKINLDLD